MFSKVSTYRYIQLELEAGLIYCDILIGSIAALIQSMIFGGQTAGWFSVLQGIGATAAISPPVVGLGCTLAVVGAGVYSLGSRKQDVKLSIKFLMYGIDVDVLFYLIDIEFHAIEIIMRSGSRECLNMFLTTSCRPDSPPKIQYFQRSLYQIFRLVLLPFKQFIRDSYVK